MSFTSIDISSNAGLNRRLDRSPSIDVFIIQAFGHTQLRISEVIFSVFPAVLFQAASSTSLGGVLTRCIYSARLRYFRFGAEVYEEACIFVT